MAESPTSADISWSISHEIFSRRLEYKLHKQSLSIMCQAIQRDHLLLPKTAPKLRLIELQFTKYPGCVLIKVVFLNVVKNEDMLQ